MNLNKKKYCSIRKKLNPLIVRLNRISKETQLTIKIVLIFALITHLVFIAHFKVISTMKVNSRSFSHVIVKNIYLVVLACLLYMIIHKNLSKMKNYINLSIDKKSNSYAIQYESYVFFNTFFNKINDGAAFAEIEEENTIGIFTDINESIMRSLGYTKEEFLKMTIYDIVDEKESDKVRLAAERLLKERQVLLETIVVAKNGTKRDLEVNGSVLNINGKNVALLLSRDITTRKNTERALLESEERYRKLIELLPVAVHIKQNRKIVYSNEAGVKLLGASDVKEFIGRLDSEFTHPDYLKLSRERGSKILTLGETVPVLESKILRIDGQEVDVEVASTRIDYNGEGAILSVIRDVTKRKKADEAIQAMMEENGILLQKAIESEKSKTEFFTNISHEFKTPLNVILGIIQLFNLQMDSKKSVDSDSYNKYIQMMRQNCYRLLRLINNLLDITKIDSGYLELNFKNHNIINIIEDVTLSVAEYAKNKGISIIFDTEVEEKVMCCDEEKIERIILNLLSNAIKYNKDTGNIYINIYDENENILISVKDTGIGIPEDKLGEVFERFKQVDTSLHRINEGSGIGLALVKSIVEKHGGEISVTSAYGEGTEFTVKLPVTVLPEEDKKTNCNYSVNSLVERIDIEFSDIYKLY